MISSCKTVVISTALRATKADGQQGLYPSDPPGGEGADGDRQRAVCEHSRDPKTCFGGMIYV